LSYLQSMDLVPNLKIFHHLDLADNIHEVMKYWMADKTGEEAIKVLIKVSPSYYGTIFNFFIQNSRNVNALDYTNETVIHRIISMNRQAIFSKGNCAFGLMFYVIEKLIQESTEPVNIDLRDKDGMTYLDWAEIWLVLKPCQATNELFIYLQGLGGTITATNIHSYCTVCTKPFKNNESNTRSCAVHPGKAESYRSVYGRSGSRAVWSCCYKYIGTPGCSYIKHVPAKLSQ